MNYNEQIREGKGFLTKIKKIAPWIYLINPWKLPERFMRKP